MSRESLSTTKEIYAFTVFERAFKEFGLPLGIRTDNGVPFASPHSLFGLSKLPRGCLNEKCSIGLGRVGRTGNYDGCGVWVVIGWLAQPVYQEASHVFYGLLHESASDPRAPARARRRRCAGRTARGAGAAPGIVVLFR